MMKPQNSTLSQKGQVTIPVQVRKQIDADPGDRIQFLLNEKGDIVMKVVKKDSLLSLFGSMPPKGEQKEKEWQEIREQARQEMIERKLTGGD